MPKSPAHVLIWSAKNHTYVLHTPNHQGHLAPLALGGQLVEIDTTTPPRFDYADLLQHIHAALFRTHTC